MLRFRVLVALVFLIALPLFAADPNTKTDESAVPGGFEWMVVPCHDWNCAAAELILAKGDSSVLVLPMTGGEHPWIVLRRVRAGSFFVPDDAPILVDTFDDLPLASTRFDGLTRHAPTLFTAPDGKKLVIYTRGEVEEAAQTIRRPR
jgi:hypothetical protein